MALADRLGYGNRRDQLGSSHDGDSDRGDAGNTRRAHRVRDEVGVDIAVDDNRGVPAFERSAQAEYRQRKTGIG